MRKARLMLHIYLSCYEILFSEKNNEAKIYFIGVEQSRKINYMNIAGCISDFERGENNISACSVK